MKLVDEQIVNNYDNLLIFPFFITIVVLFTIYCVIALLRSLVIFIIYLNKRKYKDRDNHYLNDDAAKLRYKLVTYFPAVLLINLIIILPIWLCIYYNHTHFNKDKIKTYESIIIADENKKKLNLEYDDNEPNKIKFKYNNQIHTLDYYNGEDIHKGDKFKIKIKLREHYYRNKLTPGSKQNLHDPNLNKKHFGYNKKDIVYGDDIIESFASDANIKYTIKKKKQCDCS